MSQVRRAHSVEIIDRRLRDAEAAGQAVDALELVGLHDELARVERKWIVKRDDPRNGRPLADPVAINGRFERLARLVAAAVRRGGPDGPERQLLRQADDALRGRPPLMPAAKRVDR
jgi:hypothetical protein